MKRKLLIFTTLGMMSFSVLGFAIHQVKEERFAPAVAYENHDADTYYSGISDTLEGDDLLSALQTLNSSRRKKTVGYNSMGTNASGQFKYTDYDPDTVQYDDNGQPYGTKIISFYSGNSTSSFNREHVWPNTHGGNLVEADIHMPRPTIPSENGSRSHSFFIEGKLEKNGGGWDPAMESFGKEDYRGDSARIIFYSMVASKQLTLTDDGSRSSNTNNKEMGVISDMLSWNLRYPVLEREMNRNEGAEYLQGNRNPFIDHPEYACRIWGKFNEKTEEVCSAYIPVDTKKVAIKENNETVTETTIDAEESSTFEAYVDGTAVTNVTWSLMKSNKVDAYKGDVTLDVKDGKATVTGGTKSESLYLKVSYSYVDDNGTSRLTTALCKITIKGSGVPVDSFTITYTVEGTDEVRTIGDAPEDATSTYSQTYSTAGQITSGKNAILTLSGYEGYKIDGIKLIMHSNGRSGAGTFKAEVGNSTIATTGGEFNKWYDNDSYGTDYREINVTLLDTTRQIEEGEKVKFTITASSNSLYLESIIVTFGDPGLPPVVKTIDGIEVLVEESKTNYEYGEDFVKPYVVVNYTDGTSEKASDRYLTCDGFDSSIPGDQTITVYYENDEDSGSTTYVVHVNEELPPPVTFSAIEVDLTQSKVNYEFGEEFVKPYVIVKYSDNSTEKADDSKISCTGFNSSTPGSQTITVKYRNGEDEGETTYVVVVAEKVVPPEPEPPKSNGCGGNIATASIVLSSLALSGIILIIVAKAIRKKKQQG